MTEAYLVLLLAAAALLFVISRPRGHRRKAGRRVSAIEIREKWDEVDELIRQGRPSSFRAAIMEADKLLIAALSSKGFDGDFPAKMRRAGKMLTDPEGVWSAHKLRNRMVHDLDHEMYASEAKRALSEYKRALIDLGVL